MIPPPFEYRAPDSLSEALALLREHGDEARLMAGGQSLLPMLKLRLVRPAVVIDIAGLQELKGIGEDGDAVRAGVPATEAADALRIGALVTERTLERTIAERQPLLAEAAASIGDIHIRNLGTLGGALSQADPSGDLAPAVLALGATLTAQSAAGTRAIAAHEFFSGPFDTALAEDEMVTSVEVPAPSGVRGHAYVKLTRRAGDYAVVGAAALITLMPDGTCGDARIALCAVGPTAFVCEAAGRSLQGTRLTDADLAEAGALAGNDADPASDVHASADYRRAMTPVVVTRALAKARERARARLDRSSGS
ncbi:MAG: xanthine dehydrogenase family protein subunit M [Deltaproteobacteria bacterium]|nr:xanthine dehydrogenase family protein subunit M [Deltaproteobacteria bacterium]